MLIIACSINSMQPGFLKNPGCLLVVIKLYSCLITLIDCLLLKLNNVSELM